MRLERVLGASLLLVGTGTACAQFARPVGSVPQSDATVTNAGAAMVQTSGNLAMLGESSTVTAKDHTAPVKLTRGGLINVCQTTQLHLTSASDESLLVALDRGAVELRMRAKADDVVMTPDLRLTLSEAGPLELDMRVTMNGDTCVENRGRHAPTLTFSDAFGEATYIVKPGQHVMFENGSLRKVVDKETVPCGCPPGPDEQKTTSLADAALSGGKSGPVTPKQAAEAHPFPAAESEGLAAPAPVPAEPAGQTHVQVATDLQYDPNAPKSEEAPAAQAGVPPEPVVPPQLAPAPLVKHRGGPFGAVGRFFKRLFVR